MAGSIRRRKKVKGKGKGSWTVVVDAGRGPDGRRRQVTHTVGKFREAEALLRDLLKDRDDGIDIAPEKQSVAQFLRKWLRDYAAPNVSPKTYRGYQDAIERHIIPAIGELELSKVQPGDLTSYYAAARRQGRLDGRGGLSAQTVVHHHKLLRLAFRHAVRLGDLKKLSPADAVPAPTAVTPDLVVLRPEQVAPLIAAADETPYGPLIRVALMTGCRKGELLAVRWGDLDLDASMLRVERTAQYLPGQGITFKRPKTPKSRRQVALSPEAVSAIRQLRRRQVEDRLKLSGAYRDDLDLVFCTPIGLPLDFSNLRKSWLKIVAAAGLPRLRFHDLRHACATLMLRRGINAHVVAQRLGHSNVSTTLNVYGHVLPDMQAAAAGVLDELLPTAARGTL